MNLHNDVINFRTLIANISKSTNIEPFMLEKDYYVTYLLNKIAEKQPDIIFKGGTSLSKCHKIINRFSEDIDLSLEPKTDRVTDSQRRSLKSNIIAVIEESGFILKNPDSIKSRQPLNKYIIDCHSSIMPTYIKQDLIIETSVFTRVFPTEKKEVSCFIYDFLKSRNLNNEIEQFGLRPFEIETQTLERTFSDKIFAIADFYLKNRTERLSRHIYDIHKIRPAIKINESFIDLFDKVREVRRPLSICLSAHDGADLYGTLQKIVKERYYENDFNKITHSMLFDNTTYSEAISTLEEVLEFDFLKLYSNLIS